MFGGHPHSIVPEWNGGVAGGADLELAKVLGQKLGFRPVFVQAKLPRYNLTTGSWNEGSIVQKVRVLS